MKHIPFSKRLGMAADAIRGKSAVSDERGWKDLTGTSEGNREWNELELLEHYSKSVYVFRAIKIIAERMSAVQYDLHRIANSQGDVEEVLMHEVLDVMARPNRFQTWPQLVKINITNKLLAGESYLYKVRDGRGQVVELWNIRPDLMQPIKSKSNWINGYEFQTQGAKEFFAVEDIIHNFDVNPVDNRGGRSPLMAAKSRVQVELYANEYQRDFFLNNARPDGLLVSEEAMGQEQKDEAKEDWNDQNRGRGNNSKIAFLEGGLKYQQVSTSQREMDYIESMKFTREDILVAFGVPKELMISEGTGLATGTNAMDSFLEMTIDPEVRQLFEGINEQLVRQDFGAEFYIQPESVIPEKREAMIAEFEKGVDKWLTRNEARTLLGLEPVDGGDFLYTQFGNVELGTKGAQIAEAKRHVKALGGAHVFRGRPQLHKRLVLEETLTKAVTAAVSKAMSKKKTKEVKADDDAPKKISLIKGKKVRAQYESNMNKGIDRRAAGYRQALSKMFEDQESRVVETAKSIVEENVTDPTALKDIWQSDLEVEIFTEEIMPTMQAIAQDAGQEGNKLISDATKDVDDFVITTVLQEILNERAKLFAGSVSETTFAAIADQVIAGLDEGEDVNQISTRIRSVYTDINKVRAGLIARTESTFANNAGFQASFAQSKVVNGKEWIATKDERTRPAHAATDGEIVKVNSTFSNGLDYPQEPNCRCVIAPALIQA